jgi:hypothetical protein
MRSVLTPKQLELLKANGDNAEVSAMVAMADGDALELAARVALGAFGNRGEHADEQTASFDQGYRVACREIACVLRAMRKGHPPSPDELESERLRGMLIGP